MQNITLISKWGCDGSSGHSLNKQIFQDSSNSDASLYMNCLVPLQLHGTCNGDHKKNYIVAKSQTFCHKILQSSKAWVQKWNDWCYSTREVDDGH